ncbi:MAG: CheR family methyltransferase [Acidobacteriota bacterium]
MNVSTGEESFEQILEFLRQSRGFDFTAYKRASLMRRIARRMHMVGMTTFDGYLDYLQVHSDEFPELFNTILINVTSFFRDPDVWAFLDAEILGTLIERQRAGTSLRIWSAGCASGQEAYSIAMLLAERIGLDALRSQVKIYATDVDDEALAEARRARYPARQLEEVSPALKHKYFEPSESEYTIRRDLRRCVIFGRLDLVQDAPISRVDLLICRNTMMYFNSEAQARILRRFSFSLNENAFLLLGRAEVLYSHKETFVPIDLKRRLFRVTTTRARRDLGVPHSTRERETMLNSPPALLLRDAAFDSGPFPQIMLDASEVIVAANARARHYFGIKLKDVGRPLSDLEVSYRPADLRTALHDAVLENREVHLREVRWSVGADTRYFDVLVAPLFDEHRAFLGARVTFDDVTRTRDLQTELQSSKQELDSTNEELQSTNEELETTNEELQSTVEELETTNEELQSTNEELETMNEELQSTNEELQTMNDEIRTRSTDTGALNSYLESIFTSLRSAVVVLDAERRVQLWNARAQELWGVTSAETRGAHFLTLDIGLPVAELTEPIESVLMGAADHRDVAIRATNRRGKPIECTVSVAPLRRLGAKQASGVILLMDDGAVVVGQPAPDA